MVAGKLIALYAFSNTDVGKLDTQLAELDRFAEASGSRVERYHDDRSVQPLGWPAYGQLLEDLRAGRLQELVVWRLDKLGLAVAGFAELLQELGERGVSLRSLQDDLVCRPELMLQLFHLLNAIARSQRALMGQSITEGCQQARANGKQLGGSRPGSRPRVTDAQRAEVLRLDADGRPKAFIAQRVGLSRPTVYQIIATAHRGTRRRPPGAGEQQPPA